MLTIITPLKEDIIHLNQDPNAGNSCHQVMQTVDAKGFGHLWKF